MSVRTLCLAILTCGDRSGYDIRKLVTEGSLSYFSEASYGSIYPALEKLSADGSVQSREERDPGKPARRVYAITPAGRDELRASLHTLPDHDIFRSPFLLTASCAPLISREHMARVIDARIFWIKAEIARLEAEHAECAQNDCGAPSSHLWTMEYGMTMHRTSLHWMETNRARLEAMAGTGMDAQAAQETPVAASARRHGITTLALLAATGLGLLAASPVQAADAVAPNAPRPPAVTVSHAVRAHIRETVPVAGTFVAREEIQVTSEVDGLIITEVLAEEGDSVKAGQVLARLDRSSLEVSLAQNLAQIARAEANLVQAEASFERAEALRKSGTTSAEVYDQRRAAALSARADKAALEAQRREIELKLARTEVKAMAGGIISRRTAKVGAIPPAAMAAASAEPLFRIIANGEVELEADAPETVLSRLKAGQAADVEVIGADTKMGGTLRLVSPEVSRTTRLGRVRIALATGSRVTIGTFGRADVVTGTGDGVLVPLSAVQFVPGGAQVQVVKNGVVETRNVTIGLKTLGQAQIRDGVNAGDQVVTISGTFVRGGDRVTPVDAAKH